MNKWTPFRVLLVLISIGGLFVFLSWQHINWAGFVGVTPGMKQFVFNRTLRFFVNDAFTILLLYALFNDKRYVWFAVVLQIAGVFLFLIPYFLLKINFPHYQGPLLSFLHRLVMNPILLLLLIPAFIEQRKSVKN